MQRRSRSRAALAAALVALSSSATRGLGHPGPRVWLSSDGTSIVTDTSNDDLAPTTFSPSRAFVGGIDEDTLTANGLLAEYPVEGTGIWASEFPGYQVRSDGQSGISTGSSFSFDLGPLLVFDSSSHTFKTTWQTFGTPGPTPQFAASASTSSVNTGPGITPGFQFFSYNTPSDHAHLVMALLGNGTQPVDGPQRVYALPMQLTGAGLAQSLPYYVLLGRNIGVDQPVFQDALSVVNAAIASPGGTWIVDTDGGWATTGDWFANVPNAPGAQANFGGAISAPRTVTLSGTQSVGRITFDNANRYTISGDGTLALNNGAGAATIELVSGSHSIATPLMLTSDTTISVSSGTDALTVASLQPTSRAITKIGAGNLIVNNVRASALNVTAGAVTILSTVSGGGPSSVGLLSMSASASLDLADTDLVTATSKTFIEVQVKHARNSGAWNQSGITSSAARANANGTTGLGVLSGAEYTSLGGTGLFSGLPYVVSDTLLKYTWNGDTNFSGTVNFDDYVRVDVGFNTHLTGWSNGDFDYSGSINFDDYVMIDVAFNTQNGTLARAIDYLTGDDRSRFAGTAPGVEKVMEHFEKFGSGYASAFLAAVPEPGSVLICGASASAGMCFRPRHRRNTKPFANTMIAQ